MPRGAAKIYTLSFSIPDLIRREVKLNAKRDDNRKIRGGCQPSLQ
jgi:hypothetical protein